MSSEQPPAITAFAREHLDGAVELFAAEGWDAYTEDPERTHEALVAPDRAGGMNLDIRTRAESYYVHLGATQSAGFRLTRADLGLP